LPLSFSAFKRRAKHRLCSVYNTDSNRYDWYERKEDLGKFGTGKNGLQGRKKSLGSFAFPFYAPPFPVFVFFNT
jgi:hypothetical protein